ncbi:MAG: hypothetical protein K2H35_03820 [Muribaculaceae bacterium]|nr:hypothetical protein [Muribaculaceae bacterium]
MKIKVYKKSKWLRAIAWTAGIVVGVPMLLLTALSIYLTPDRLTNLINKEGSEYLNADIHAEDVDYSLWRTFPRFKVSTGRVSVTSRTLRDISPEIRRQLPDSADFLGSIDSFTGEINVVDLFMNRYVIHDVDIDGLRLNLVAYNDSINNYNIVPATGSGFKKIPYISAVRIELNNPGVMSYRSVSTDTHASLALKSFVLSRIKGHREKSNTYHLGLSGDVTASSAGLTILKGFPFNLGGRLHLRFDPFGVSLSDYAINLGEIQSKLSMSVGVGDDPRIESFDYKIKKFSVTGLLGYLPKEFVPTLQGFDADLQVSASARLISAWSISSETLPSIAVDFKVPAGEVLYTLALPQARDGAPREAVYRLSHSPIEGDFIFNGAAPDSSYFSIKEFNIASDGVDVGVSAMLSRLTTHPLIQAGVNIRADVARSLRLLPYTPPVNADGEIVVNSDISFSISDFSRRGLAEGLTDFMVNADVEGKNLIVEVPDMNIKGKLGNINLTILQETPLIDTLGAHSPHLTLDGKGKSIDMTMPGGRRLTAQTLRMASKAGSDGIITPSALAEGLPVSIATTLGNIRFASTAENMTVTSPEIKVSDILRMDRESVAEKFLVDGVAVASPEIEFISGRNRFVTRDLQFAGRLAIPAIPGGNAPADAEPAEGGMVASRIGTDGLPHTPELIDFTIPDGLRQFMSQYGLSTSLQIGRVDIFTPGFRHNNYLANIDFTLTDNQVDLRNLDVMLENTKANLRMDAGNLRSFLLNPASASNPLRVGMNLALDTVNINALAHAYVESKGGMNNIPRHDKVTASDSVALLVPKNIAARIGITAKEINYTNLDLTDLVADVNLHDGIADIPSLGIASEFGRADLNVVYNSADIDRLNLGLGVNIGDIDIVKFFKKFNALLRAMPEMKNLSGYISAAATMKSDIFPDMYMNIPSVAVDMNVKARDLIVKQSPFIRRITKMMLIENGGDIHIHDMNVHGDVRNNLLQLDPFYFEFERYRLQMLGVNNFNGDLYYHIAVDKSPVPFPFSVNIEGNFSDPKLRFGGGHFDEKHAERITSQIQEDNSVNMVLVLRQMLRALIGHASDYQQKH